MLMSNQNQNSSQQQMKRMKHCDNNLQEIEDSFAALHELDEDHAAQNINKLLNKYNINIEDFEESENQKTKKRDRPDDQFEKCLNHTWNYTEEGMRSCITCKVSSVCPHINYTFDLGHRTCSDCNIVPFGLEITRGPPSLLVYNRNIKLTSDQNTAPLISVGMNQNDPTDWSPCIRSFSVEVCILADGTYEAFNSNILKGTAKYTFSYDDMVKGGGKSLIFKGLKIMVTSKQKKTTVNGNEIKDNSYLLEWTFKAHKKDGTDFVLAKVRSQSITVFSHGKQINEIDSQQVNCAIISDIIPSRGDIETPGRYALFGSDFYNGCQIKIGKFIINLTCHNDGAAWFDITENMLASFRLQFDDQLDIKIELEICNDKKTWISSGKYLTFENETALAQQLLGDVGSDLDLSKFTESDLDLSKFSSKYDDIHYFKN